MINIKRALFVGRWTPFHNGHLEIMKEKIEKKIPLLILIRDTPYDLYSVVVRKEMIERTLTEMGVDAKVEIIEDIESVNWGRGVGYEVNEISVSSDVAAVSATKIRELISKKDDAWKEMVPKGTREVLEKYHIS